MFANNHLPRELFPTGIETNVPTAGRLTLLFATPSTFHYRKYHKYQSFFSTPCVFPSICREERLDPVRSAEETQSISRDFVVNRCQVKRIYQRAARPSRPCFPRNFAIQHATEKYIRPRYSTSSTTFHGIAIQGLFSAKGTEKSCICEYQRIFHARVQRGLNISPDRSSNDYRSHWEFCDSNVQRLLF